MSAEPTIPPQRERPTVPAGDTSDSAPPTAFGDFEIIDEIARGGMGVVYRARQTKLDRIVALKTILEGHFASEDAVRQFYAEAQAAAKLSHTGIVPVHELGEAHGRHYFSMPLIEGPSLAQLLAKGPMDPDEAARLLKATAETIHFAHENGIVHRDLKPANILVERGQPRVTDFGLAKMTDGHRDTEDANDVMGTPGYMSPEQAAGNSDATGVHSDVYSLGATLYCMLTGRPPFQSADPVDTILQILQREPVPPRTLNPAVPRDLELVCLKCLEKDPSRRYHSAQQLSAELDRFLNGQPLEVRPVGTFGTLWRWAKRQPRMASLSVALIVANLAILGLSLFYNLRLREERSAAIEAQQAASLAARRADGHQRVVRELLQELSQSTSSSDLRNILSYSDLGEVCSQAQRLLSADRKSKPLQLERLEAAASVLSKNWAAGVLEKVADLTESVGNDADPEQLAADVDQLTQSSRILWQEASERIPQMRDRLNQALQERLLTVAGKIAAADEPFLVRYDIDSLHALLDGEFAVVAPQDALAAAAEFRTIIDDWITDRTAAAAVSNSFKNLKIAMLAASEQ